MLHNGSSERDDGQSSGNRLDNVTKCCSLLCYQTNKVRLVFGSTPLVTGTIRALRIGLPGPFRLTLWLIDSDLRGIESKRPG